MKNKLKSNIKFIIFGVGLTCFIVWFVIGMRFITPDSEGMQCFFAATLPFLGMFAMLGCILRTAWNTYKAKRAAKKKEEV